MWACEHNEEELMNSMSTELIEFYEDMNFYKDEILGGLLLAQKKAINQYIVKV